MPTPANSINEATTGIVGFTGTAFTASPSTQYNIQIGGATSSTLANVAPSATSGVPLVSQGSSSNPAFSTAVVAGGGTGQVTLTNHGVLIGQSTSAIAATAAGSAGQVLQSGGASADPTYSTATFPSTATGTGKILRADGTNWVATTATYPTTAGTSGNVLTSDGTNWISSAATGGGINSVTLPLTNAQLKALNTTGIQILAGQGSGTVIVIVSVVLKLIYGGTNAFTNSPSTTIGYGTTPAATGGGWVITVPVGFWQATASQYYLNPVGAVATGISTAATVAENGALYIQTSTNITGNAAGDNTAKVQVNYYVISI